MPDVVLPQLGESVTEGTITRWFKSVGDTVVEDEPLSRCRPTRSTPRSPPRPPGCSPRCASRRATPSRSAPCWPCSVRGNPLPVRLPRHPNPHRNRNRLPDQNPHPHPQLLRANRPGPPLLQRLRRQLLRPVPHRGGRPSRASRKAVCCRRWCGAWSNSTAWTSTRSPAPASEDASPARTCSTRLMPRPPHPSGSPPLRRPHPVPPPRPPRQHRPAGRARPQLLVLRPLPPPHVPPAVT